MLKRSFIFLLLVALMGVLVVPHIAAQDAKPTVAVVTPYLAQPGTQFMVDAFKKAAEEKGWTVNVVDTAGDINALNSRLQDVVTQKVDAIVINVDPSQVPALKDAAAAKIPVFGMDAGNAPEVLVNVTSNGYAMAAETASYVVDRLGGEGGVVMFEFPPYPPVQKRGVIAEAIFGNTPDIKIIDKVVPDVTDGGIADSRAKMEAILQAHPEAGSIKAVWAAWDQPALGALQAIEAAGRDKEGIVIVGIDANPQALDAIQKGGTFEASVAQDFTGIGSTVADQVEKYLKDGKLPQKTVYVPTTLVTAANVAEFIAKTPAK
jgi:ribose transport system substrate-binding protein